MAPPLFVWELDHGCCAGVALPDGGTAAGDAGEAVGALLAEERAAAASMAPARRRTWVGGRAAMRATANALGVTLPPIGSDDRGAPVLPHGFIGSISHKDELAVALLAREARDGVRVGVDVERDAPRRIDVSRKVLRDEELTAVAAMTGEARAREVLLRFSLKEAVYKALDPFVRRYVGFHEVAATPETDGRVAVRLELAKGEGPFHVDARWRRVEGLIVTTARVEAFRSGEARP
ncbi:MAG TPA: 4'-phosphopantetheinyl transferase superfamily protein [Polyangiaceae bacterium]|jgi:4'-phosphopantetheinyl transferase EntD